MASINFSSAPLILFLVLLLELCSSAEAFFTKQQVLREESNTQEILGVRAALKKAEIIPTVIDEFLPYLSLNITWPTNESADLGNTLRPNKLQDPPSIELRDDATSSEVSAKPSNMTYTIVLTDPDAPSRDDPKWSEFCHWIETNVTLSQESTLFPSEAGRASIRSDLQPATHKTGNNPNEIIKYKPPGPPPKTGKHRYVFLVFAPANSTSKPLDLTKPKDRQHWGYKKQEKGVRKWAKENGLVPVAANFIYAENEEQ